MCVCFLFYFVLFFGVTSSICNIRIVSKYFQESKKTEEGNETDQISISSITIPEAPASTTESAQVPVDLSKPELAQPGSDSQGKITDKTNLLQKLLQMLIRVSSIYESTPCFTLSQS